jgi:hypothetical protein
MSRGTKTALVGLHAVALLLLFADLGWTQSRGMARPMSVSGGRGVRVAHRIATPLNPSFATIRGVPGLGFDFEHLVAISRASPNRFGRARRVPFITPLFFDQGFPGYYDYDYGYDQGVPYDAQPQPPVVPIQQPPQAFAQPSDAQPLPAQTPAQAVPEAPPPEIGQLILVRRDGQVVLAVAFTTAAGRLTYITRDGARHSFPVAELDQETTRQMNDANGTTVALPN